MATAWWLCGIKSHSPFDPEEESLVFREISDPYTEARSGSEASSENILAQAWWHLLLHNSTKILLFQCDDACYGFTWDVNLFTYIWFIVRCLPLYVYSSEFEWKQLKRCFKMLFWILFPKRSPLFLKSYRQRRQFISSVPIISFEQLCKWQFYSIYAYLHNLYHYAICKWQKLTHKWSKNFNYIFMQITEIIWDLTGIQI